MPQKLDLRGFEVTAGDRDLIKELRFCRSLDLRGHAIPSEIASLLTFMCPTSLGVTVQLIFLAPIGWWHY